MPLNVYLTKSEIPSGMQFIEDNAKYFDSVVSLKDTKFTRDVLRLVDDAEYVSSIYFRSLKGDFGNLNVDNLSTGAKTLFNVQYSPNVCFNVACCGNNALLLLGELHEGNVYWQYPAPIKMRGYPWDCDLKYDGVVYKTFEDFFQYLMDNRRY